MLYVGNCGRSWLCGVCAAESLVLKILGNFLLGEPEFASDAADIKIENAGNRTQIHQRQIQFRGIRNLPFKKFIAWSTMVLGSRSQACAMEFLPPFSQRKTPHRHNLYGSKQPRVLVQDLVFTMRELLEL